MVAALGSATSSAPPPYYGPPQPAPYPAPAQPAPYPAPAQPAPYPAPAQPAPYPAQPAPYPAPAQPPRQAAPAQPAQPHSLCEYACGQLARCHMMPYGTCLDRCRETGAEQQPGGPAQLDMIARSSCETIAAAVQSQQGSNPPSAPTASPPARKPAAPTSPKSPTSPSWMCSAEGTWKDCKAGGFPCNMHSSRANGWGGSEQSARVFAESECSSQMTRMMMLQGLNISLHLSIMVVSQCRSTTCTPPPSSR